MAQSKKSNTRKSNSSRKTNTSGQSRNRNQHQSEPMDVAIKSEVILIALFALCVFLFLCNFGIIGVMGNAISGVMFGIFGLTAYLIPVFLFMIIAFAMINSGNMIATRKIIAAVCLYLIVSMMCELFTKAPQEAASYDFKEIYVACSTNRNGGGILGGSFAYLAYHFLGLIGTILSLLVIAIIALIVITDKSFMKGVKNGSQKVYERSREDAAYRRERAQKRREEAEELRKRREEERRLREEQKEDQKILRMDKKVTGVMLDTSLTAEHHEEPVVRERDDIHEINLSDFEEQLERPHAQIEEEVVPDDTYQEPAVTRPVITHEDPSRDFDFSKIRINGEVGEQQSDDISEIVSPYEEEEIPAPVKPRPAARLPKEDPFGIPLTTDPQPKTARSSVSGTVGMTSGSASAGADRLSQGNPGNQPVRPKEYQFPPISLLTKSMGKENKNSGNELRETAQRLQQTLQTFGVRVTITDISQGPAVTRYELQPEQGVKVSKIVGLADDIKLNLAATDIRIEAPIPGKAAIGIEVPNKENTAVGLRELLETDEFKKFPSNIAFAVGKDIAGRVVVSDIAKMPHMLIAGATGSGKSVCINTLIMSILYKADPSDVKLIMVDPKVVELSVYNGIPHLMIPVVTDPKKASAALQWGVAEMTDRYQKFADFNVRDLKGYNKKVEDMVAKGDPQAPKKMPQIVIIVDELADLMMVSPGEVEESICRLAQLARAAGIHLIIATQRPSVDVITGLIKANMPSRIAFSVSSGVDSRTILDMNGAEKLLGKGDMLFYPQGYTKPVRVQGAFVSDKEVSDVVEFLKNQQLGNIYDSDIQEKMESMGSASGDGHGGSGGGNEWDQYFVDAAQFIIEKDKASIGMLQRVFKIGFNRAARIMDQLCEAGVVGEEEGTKPRKVLMSQEQFEQYIEEYL
ncbi:MAG: DNA translocase FtsK [Lachnospiraceae bacterium]|nr:DNA translocase FtsK [Lachnospiraceae bacterium]